MVEGIKGCLQTTTAELRAYTPPGRREQLLEALEGVTSVRFNSSREIYRPGERIHASTKQPHIIYVRTDKECYTP